MRTCFIIFCLVVLYGDVLASPPTTTIRDIEHIVANTSTPPPANASWQPVSLPYSKYPRPYESMADYEQNWFRIPISELHLNAWSRPSLYIWRHNVRAGVYFNHSFLGGTTQTPPIEQLNISWNHPLLIDITHSIHAPPAQGPSADYIYIKVDSGPGGTTLSPLVFGDRPALEGIYNKRHFLQIEVSFWLFILCCLLSVLGIWLWIQRRDEQLYLEFSALAAFSALTTSFFFLDFVPIGMQAWITLHHAGSAWEA